MTSPMFDMTGRHALVTGAGSGIGTMISQAYYNQGATVYLVGRRPEKLEDARNTISKSNDGKGKLIVLPGDVSTREAILKLVADFSKHSSVLDVLVSNAGIIRTESVAWKESLSAEEMSEHFLSSSVEDWTETTTVNTTAMWHLSGAFLPFIQKSQHGGNILIISSINGVHWAASSCIPSYAASKAAANHLTKVMANKLRGLYIRVNTIAPGMFPSEMNNEAAIKRWEERGTLKLIPAKKLGTSEEMGSAAVFLATNSYVDGQVLVVDGGRSLTASGS